MCGIVGIVNFNKGNSDLTSRVNSMAEEIVHRGPDFKAIFKNNMGVFGFLRLSIIDLSVNSNQPFQTDDKKISIIYNGEIYNFKKLKNTYFKNKNFRSKGDGEILLYLYIKFGINFLSKIKGMFSICIVDENLKKIFLIRDRFGIKPLYYYFNSAKHCLYFSSEIKSIFCNREIKKELNYKEAFKFFKQGLVNGSSETWFKNIFQVKSAHYLEFDEKNINQKKYYSLEDNIDEDEDKYDFKTIQKKKGKYNVVEYKNF